MILQLHGYPLNVDGVDVLASGSTHYRFVVQVMRWIMLNESDWTMLPDSPLTDSERQDWKTWRQYLRDITTSLPEVLGETLEITDPPIHHCSATWINLTPSAGWAHTHDDTDGHTH